MNSEGFGSRGRPAHAPRGHRPYRGGGSGGGRGRGGARGGHRGRGGHPGARRGGGPAGVAASIGDPALDPQLAPRPPHPGFFHTSFLENPWHDLEEKLGIPHIKAVVPPQPQSSEQNKIESGEPVEQAPALSQQNGAAT